MMPLKTVNEGVWEFVFCLAKQKNSTLYSLLPLCKWYYLHCQSAALIRLCRFLPPDVRTTSFSMYPSCSLLFCCMSSGNHSKDHISCCPSFLPVSVHLVSFCVPSPLVTCATWLKCEILQTISCRWFYFKKKVSFGSPEHKRVESSVLLRNALI